MPIAAMLMTDWQTKHNLNESNSARKAAAALSLSHQLLLQRTTSSNAACNAVTSGELSRKLVHMLYLTFASGEYAVNVHASMLSTWSTHPLFASRYSRGPGPSSQTTA